MEKEYQNSTEGRQPEKIREIRSSLCMTKGNTVQNSIDNCLSVLEQDPRLKGSIRYNCLTERVDVERPLGRQMNQSPALTDSEMDHLIYYFEKNYGITNEKKILKAVNIVAEKNQYHPIQEYLKGLTWDSTQRIRFVLHHFLGAEVSDDTESMMRLFLLGAISRVFQPGCKFDYMLCLIGSQGSGKSTFFRFLAVNDDWFSDDLRRIDDDNVYRKLQGHWIIEMSEMIATANAKSIEDIKDFLSRSRETYKVPYETYPKDRLRQCVFGGTSNAIDFLPLDRSGNRRFLPVMTDSSQAEVHILDDEKASRAYIDQVWAEAMTIYRQGGVILTLTKEMNSRVAELQKDFMPEDTKLGMIQDYLDHYDGNQVCSKQLFQEALKNSYLEPRQWEIREINDIMNNSITGWKHFNNPRRFREYGRQKGWERDNAGQTILQNPDEAFQLIPQEEAEQMELPFDE